MMQEDDTALTIARSILNSYILTLDHCKFGRHLGSGNEEAFYASDVVSGQIFSLNAGRTVGVQWDRVEGEV